MLPFKPIATFEAVRQLSSHYGLGEGDSLSSDLSVFIRADTVMVDAEFAEDLSIEAEMFKAYVEQRNGDYVKSWELAQKMLSEQAFVEWESAYYNTRDNPAPADPDLTEGDDEDPKGGSADSKS